MKKTNKKKNKKSIVIPILSIILVIAVSAVGILSYILVKNQKAYDENKLLQCVFEKKEDMLRYDMYFHFNKGVLSQYTVINTRKASSETSLTGFKKLYDNSNNNYEYMTSKVVQDSDKIIITENYNYEGYTIEELKNQKAYFIYKEKEIASRSKILEIFEAIKNGGNDEVTLYGPEESWKNTYISCE